MKEKKEFKHESLQDRQSLAEYLKALTEGFSSGTLKFSDKDGEITLNPKGLVTFEVKALRKRGQVQLKLKLSWKDGTGPQENGHDALRIRN